LNVAQCCYANIFRETSARERLDVSGLASRQSNSGEVIEG